MQNKLVYGVIGLGVTLLLIGGGAWYVDREQAYCITDRCHQTVAARKAAQKAKRLEVEAKSQISALVVEAAMARNKLVTERSELLAEVSSCARKKKREARSSEWEERTQQARVAPYMTGGAGYLATEASNERIRDFQVAQLEWEKWIVSAGHNDFFTIPAFGGCEIGRGQCSETLRTYSAAVVESLKRGLADADTAGMSGDDRIRTLSNLFSEHAKNVASLAERAANREQRFPPE